MKGIKAAERYLRRNSSTILSFVGAAGVIVTAVLAVQATPKAMELLEEAKEEKGEDLTKFEIINVAGPAYIPSVAVGLTTIVCIFGANVLSHKQQLGLISAYGLLDQSYKEYKNKVKEILGEDGDYKVREAIVKDKYESDDISTSDDDKLLFYEDNHGYFTATMEEILDAELNINKRFAENGLATLNEFYEFLGLDKIHGCDLIGWESDSMDEFYNRSWIDFEHQLVELGGGLECYILETPVVPYSIL